MAYRRTATVQARLDAQRERILAAATALLADVGYSGCSMTAVAERAGVAPGTLYNYVSGKADLIAEVFRTVATGELQAVRSAVGAASGTAEELTAVVETFAARALKAPRLASALLVESVDPSVEKLRAEFRREFRDVFADVIRRGVSSGRLPPQDAAVVAAALVGAIAEGLSGRLSGRTETDTVETIVLLTLRAVGLRQDA
jgi:AcrR family transcriptional regulator